VGLRELGCGGLDWIYLAQDRVKWRALGKTVMKVGVGKFLNS
jgi:hypothetical protein